MKWCFEDDMGCSNSPFNIQLLQCAPPEPNYKCHAMNLGSLLNNEVVFQRRYGLYQCMYVGGIKHRCMKLQVPPG